MIAYQTAYLKANYPVEYMAGILSVESQSNAADEKIAQYIEECRRLKIKILPPRINTSQVGFTIEKDKESFDNRAIRYGLAAIKNVGVAAIESIVEARKESRFTSLTDFCSRIDNRKVNKRVIESLVNVGAFDEYGTRPSVLAGYEEIRNKAMKKQEKKESGQFGLFDAIEDEDKVEDNLPDLPDYTPKEKLEFEKKLLGVYLTDHPLAAALKEVGDIEYTRSDEIDLMVHKGKKVTLVGMIQSLRQILTKKGKEMAFATLEDLTGKVDMVIFPNTYAEVKFDLSQGQAYMVKGTVEDREGDISYLVDSLKPLTAGVTHIDEQTNPNTLTISRDTSQVTLEKVGKLLKSNPGEDIVTIAIPSKTGSVKTFVLPYRINFSDELQNLVREMLK